jgi:RHS repeat-associated protein
MKVSRSARIVFFCLAVILFQTDRFMALAATPPPGACLYALDPTADRAFQIAGAQSVYAACGVVVESSASDGFEMEGAETLYLQNHAQVSVVGGAQLNGQTKLWDTISNKQVQSVRVSSPGDPLASIAPPASGTIVSKTPAHFDMNAKPANNTLSPGVYCGGLTIGNTNGTAFTINPGTYIMAGGGLVLNSQAVVKGTGVTVYNTSSAGWGCSSSYKYTPVTISGQVTATLSAPTTGAYNGILFFGNRSGCSTKGSCVDQINGGSTVVLNGALYFPSDEIQITGNSSASGFMMLVADKIYINGNTTFGNNGNPFDGITVSVTPSTVTLFSGQTQQFTAIVSNSANSAVTWTITPAGVGSISSSGLYTAPSIVTALQTVTITATSQADTSKSGTAAVTLAVAKTTPTITWTTPAAITYGTALSPTQLDATASVPGTFVYMPAAGAVLTAGSQTLSVAFTPTNTTSYNTAAATVILTVNKATPVINWAVPAAITYGTALSSTLLDATASVAGMFVYTPASGTVLAAGAQTLSVTFTPTTTAEYKSVTATVPLAVTLAALTITASSPTVSYGAPVPAINPLYSGWVSGQGSSSLTTQPTCTTAYTPASAVGSSPSTSCSGAVDANYTISYVAGTVTITQANVTLSCSPTPITYGTALSVSQLGCSSGGVSGSYTLTPAAGTVLTAGSQSISVSFTPADTTDYGTATATVTLPVNQAVPVITWATPAAINSGTALSATQLDATASVPGTFAYTPTAGTVLPAGAQALSVTFLPTDTIDYTTATASVSLTVNETQCTSNGYSYQRAIVIDHTKVPNTDQVNFPFLFNTTDPTLALATATNGGHVTSPNGYDIIFTSDPAGQNILNYEMEEYDPVHGQVIAWVRIPTLSHTTDTVLYVFYGNPSITTSQQNPTGVWDSNYQAVYHLANVGTGTAADSTANGNNGTLNLVSTATGEIDGAVGFNGASSYIQIPEQDFQSFFPTSDAVFSESFEVWFKTASNGVILSVDDGTEPNNAPGSYVPALYIDNAGMLRASFYWHGSASNQIVTIEPYNDNKWHYAVDTYNGKSNNYNGSETGTETLFVDGNAVGTQTVTDYSWSNGTQLGVFLGTGWTGIWPSMNGSWYYFNGALDDVKLSGIARSADWIATAYNNQVSPSTFYTLFPENAVEVFPATVNLYAGQSQQFEAAGVCGSALTWSMPIGALGMLTSSGLYTTPASINTKQTVTITATSQVSSTTVGSAIVTLLPPPPPITLTAASQPPYMTGSSQGFVATLQDQFGTPESGVAVTFTVAGVNNNTGIITTDNNGIASYAYIGSNSGSDTVQATAVVNGQQLTSNNVPVSWASPIAANAEGSVTIQAGVNVGLTGLCGAFTDSNGAVIEPIAIGASPRVFVVPSGATQLQLGVVDDRYGDNSGSGFVVEVNKVITTVLPTTMPWNWVAGGLNTNYKFGILDGTSPIVPLTGLTQGAEVSIAYQSGTVSAGGGWPYVNAGSEPQMTTGVGTGSTGTYFPTLYLTASNYPVGEPIPITAVVTNSSGAPIASVPVMLHISGANAQELETTTDSTGTASFTYSGINAGTDVLEAQAYLTGEADLVSSQTSVTWSAFTSLPPSGTITLTPNTIQPLPAVGQQAFTVYAADAAGNPAANVKLEMAISGVDNIDLFKTTDSTGHASFTYQDVNPGVASVIVSGLINGVIAYSNQVSVSWTLLATITTTPIPGNGTMSGSITALPAVTLPNTLSLTGTITDSNTTATITTAWSQVSGPGTITFTNPLQLVTTASFSQAGIYGIQLSASDSAGNSTSGQLSVTVNSVPNTPQGWIGSPVYGSAVSGVVPITLASGITLQSGTQNPQNMLFYYPANNPNNITNLPITSESGTIAMLDTTTLVNGSYWIQLQATDTNGDQQYALVLVTVAGNYKPGRVTATVTDLVVPATGLAINIQRTYDSLNAGTSGDFGYGWNLGINVNLVVDNAGNVTFTLGGQRKTFNLAPTMPPCTIVGCLFPYYFVVYTPEPGLYGTLTDGGSGCALDILIPDGSLWDCQGGGQYSPTSYIYTDPNGTAYTISAAGNLQAIQDRSGNGLTITPNGITSTTGLNVPFVRDANHSNRITKITDPQGNVYQYGYDTNGNLATVTYPVSAQSTSACPGTTASGTSTYTYDPTFIHLYAGGTDGRGCPLPTTAYYPSGATDANGNSLSGRLQSVQDALGETTSYAYILSTTSIINGVSVPNTGVTTITYPADASGIAGTATMIYDSYGMLLSSEDPLNNTTLNAYDTNHNLISTTDPLGNITTSTYDANSNKTSSTYPATSTSHNTTSYTYYNQYSEPTSTTDELGNVRSFNYDANYNPQSVTDSIGTLASFIFNANQTLAAGAIGFDITSLPAMASQFSYDANGNMASRTDALGRTTSYVYNSLGQKTSMVTPTPAIPTGGPGSTTSYTYDPFGNLTQTAAPLNRITSSTYDANGNKTSDTDALGNVTNYQYDALNRLIETDYPSNATTPATKSTKSYDFRNNVIDEIDQANNDTHHEYDPAGRQTKVTRGYGSSTPSATSYAYDNANRKTSETDALGNTTNYNYDADSRLTAISGVAGNFQYAYDDAGNRISSTDGKGNKTSYQYDARKRLIETDYPDETSVKNTYDGPGNLASVTDQAEHLVQYTYDAANQLASVIQHNSPYASPQNTNSFGYDPLGNLTGLTDERGDTTSNLFDVLNELKQKTLPDQTHIESRTYDTAGNLITLTHFNGVTTTYTYDALNRLLTRATPGEATVSFTYTATGKYKTSTALDGTVSYSYDTLDRLTTKTTPEGTLSYTYYADGKVETITSHNANGASVAYTYDDLNRLSTVVDNNLPGQNTTSYTYDPASNVATVKIPNQLQSTFNYDALNRLTEQTTSTSPVTSYTYALGATGNRTKAVESNNSRTVNWSYNDIYRLTGETITGDTSNNGDNNGSVTYTLDPVGNRSSAVSSLAPVPGGSWGYNADDQQVSSESYDLNGNTTKEANGNIYTYDSENHMLTASGNGKSVTMIYDAFGNRVAKTVNGVTTQYLVEDDVNPTGYPQVIEELTGPIGAGVVTRTYTYGLQRISQLLSPAVSGNSTWTPSFYVYDGAGSVRQLTDSTGTVTDEYEYDAYGNSFTKSGTTPNNYLYRGEQYDSDLALYYLRARYYNPATGRFLSRDPEDGKAHDPKSLHKYLYVGGDPVNGIDPRGRASMLETGSLDAMIGPYVVTTIMKIGLAVACVEIAVQAALDKALHQDLTSIVPWPLDIACIFLTL